MMTLPQRSLADRSKSSLHDLLPVPMAVMMRPNFLVAQSILS